MRSVCRRLATCNFPGLEKNWDSAIFASGEGRISVYQISAKVQKFNVAGGGVMVLAPSVEDGRSPSTGRACQLLVYCVIKRLSSASASASELGFDSW